MSKTPNKLTVKTDETELLFCWFKSSFNLFQPYMYQCFEKQNNLDSLNQIRVNLYIQMSTRISWLLLTKTESIAKT